MPVSDIYYFFRSSFFTVVQPVRPSRTNGEMEDRWQGVFYCCSSSMKSAADRLQSRAFHRFHIS